MALITSFQRFFNPPLDYSSPAIQPLIEASYGQSAHWIEGFVKGKIPYRYDWENYNYPWYFPTVEEVLAKGSGDCKSHLVVIASILSFYEIPFSLYYSASHIWLSYQGKVEIEGETEKEVTLSYSEDKGFEFRKAETDWDRTRTIFKEANWHYMPLSKKVLLFQTFFSCLSFTLMALMIEKLKKGSEMND